MLTSANTLVLVPALNEQSSIGAVIEQLHREGFTVLVMNDGSTDQTSLVAKSHGAIVLDLPYNMGVGGALRVGFQVAIERGYEAVVQVDADGQHPVSSIQNLIDEANASGAHLVVGSRFIADGTTMNVGFTRRMVMRFLAWSASRATGVDITDSSSGFRLIRNPLLEQFSRSFSANYLGDTYEALVSAGRAGYAVREIPAAMMPRRVGVSSASLIQSIQFTLKGVAVSVLRLHPHIKRLDRQTGSD
jgi:glycosyltransferase involved in cell wall biosynthesis